MADPLAALLARLTVDVSLEPVALLGLPPGAWPAVQAARFGDPAIGESVLLTPDELTLLVPWGRVPEARGRFPGVRVEGPFRLLTLEVDLAWDVVGFLARVTAALASEGIPVGALASVRRDHLLVPEARVDDALAVLERLRKSTEA